MSNRKIEAITLLLSEVRGVYIPRDFVKGFDLSVWNLDLTDEDLNDLASPENDCYLETWQFVLDNAKYTKDDFTWYLYQDGDLFAVCDDLMTKKEKLDFFGEDYE